MKYETIIRESIDDDDTGISRKFLADLALAEIKKGEAVLFHYDNVAMTVDAKGPYPEAHFYTLGAGMSGMRCGRQFMRDIWTRTKHNQIYARTKNPKIMRFAEIFGWKRLENYPKDYAVFMTERSIT